MRLQPYEPSPSEHAIRSMLLRSERSGGGLYLPGGPVLVRRRIPQIDTPLHVAPAQVGTATFNSGSGSTWSATRTVTAGSLLRVIVRLQDEPANVTTPISSSPANTWVVDKNFIRAEGNVQTLNAYALNAASGSTTISGTTQSGGGTDWEVEVTEYSGVATSSALDVGTDQTDSGSSADKTSGVTASTTQASAIAIGTFCDLSAGAYSWSALDSYTLAGGSTNKIATTYLILSATGAQEARATCGGTFRSVDCRIAVFKAAAGGGSTVPVKLVQYRRRRVA